jgi:hypothetical protein
MKINTETSYLYSNSQPTQAATQKAPVTSTTTISQTSDIRQLDFSNMRRQELFDWINDQLRTGKMSFDESSSFLGMTLKISVDTGQPVDMATDSSRINFIEKARLGLEAALLRKDAESARSLQTALDIMQREQGQTIGVNAQA